MLVSNIEGDGDGLTVDDRISRMASSTPSVSGVGIVEPDGTRVDTVVSTSGLGEDEGSPAFVVVTNDEAADDVAAVTVAATVPVSTMLVLSSSPSPLKSGRKRVHQKAIRMPLSTTRCFRMKSTIRKKKATAARIKRRSSQSDFSRAVIRCLDVLRRVESVSCATVVERRLADDCSSNYE